MACSHRRQGDGEPIAFRQAYQLPYNDRTDHNHDCTIQTLSCLIFPYPESAQKLTPSSVSPFTQPSPAIPNKIQADTLMDIKDEPFRPTAGRSDRPKTAAAMSLYRNQMHSAVPVAAIKQVTRTNTFRPCLQSQAHGTQATTKTHTTPSSSHTTTLTRQLTHQTIRQ